jgi:hypothetical protein
MTSHANIPREYGYGECWYYCPFCGFYDHENDKTYVPEPNTVLCEGCGTIIGIDERKPHLKDGVYQLRFRYGLTLIYCNAREFGYELAHEPFLPHDLNRFYPFKPGMNVFYRRYPDEVFAGRVIEFIASDKKSPWCRDGEAVRVSFSNWVDPDWRRPRARMPRGHRADHVIGVGSLFVPKRGEQGVLFS